MSKPKILTIDIETSPAKAYVWGAWKQNIMPKQILEDAYILSYAAKWLHEDEVMYEENRNGVDSTYLLESIAILLDEADIVIAHNGRRFDEPWIKGQLALKGIDPPSPYKSIDTLQSARRHFRFIHNSLEYLTKAFGVTQKLNHKEFPGFELWSECLNNNPKAWYEMKLYNVHDVISLEELYLRMRPWIDNHPNLGVYMEEDHAVCPKCGSKHIHYRGYAYTNVSKFKRFQCQDCGGWGRTRFTEFGKIPRKQLTVNAL